MSHNQSPGPSALPSSQMFVQPPSVTPSARQKNKPLATGIAAGVEDEKYQAKYKELKRKVKEIEMDNDKLHYKVLMAKKSIQRMKLERAVLYERLSAVPPSPDLHAHASLPPMHPTSGAPQHAQHNSGSGQHRDSRSMDINDPNMPDYVHTSGNIRVISGPDGRPVQVSDAPIGPGVPPSHPVSAVHLSRRGSASGHDSRQLPPLSQLTPVQLIEHPRGQVQPQPHASHLHSYSNGSDARSRPHSSSHSRGQAPTQPHQQGGIPHPQQHPLESVSSGQGLQSPPLGREREHSRRYDTHERGDHGGDPYPYGRHQMTHASPHSTAISPTSARGSTSRVHNHQRVEPGTNINNPDFEHEHDLDRERNWSRQQRELDYDRETPRDYTNSASARNSPPPHLRSRPERDYQDHSSYRPREEQIYLRESIGSRVYGRSSRSDTPGSGSGSAEAQPRSDAHSQYYDRERHRPYAPQGPNLSQPPNEDIDIVHEDGRRSHNRDRDRGGSYIPPEQHRPPLEPSRKRSRNDMDIDGEDDVISPPGDSSGGGDNSLRYGGSHRTDDRGSKRLHQEGIPSSAPGYGGHDEPEEGRSDD